MKFVKGYTPWNKNKKCSQLATRKGKTPWNKGTKGIMKAWNKGKKIGKNLAHSIKTKGKISWNKGKKLGYIPKRAFKKGRIPWNKNKECSHWTQTLKRSIREKDRYICQICGELQGDRALCVHHIDYDKKNCDPNNLISLCEKCHQETNRNREYWTNYFLLKLQKVEI